MEDKCDVQGDKSKSQGKTQILCLPCIRINAELSRCKLSVSI